jgi:CRISPR/Cas system CSM-associated protein Csm2 small subunit
MSFFLQIEALVQRKKPEQYDLIKNVCFNSKEETEIIEIIILLNKLLDEIKLTRVDTTKVYDTTNIELENEEHGF